MVVKIRSKKTLIKFITSSFVSIPLSLVVSFISLKVIEPYYLGLWASVTIIEVYSNIMRLGIVNGMNRELPYAIGKGDDNSAKEIVQTTLFYTLLTIIIVFISSPIISFSFATNDTKLIALLVVLVIIIFNQYSTFLTGTFRTSDNFNKLSNIQFLVTATKLLCIPLVLYFSFIGYLIMHLLVSFTGTLLLHQNRPFRYKPKIYKDKLLLLFKVGFPVFLSSFAIGFIDTFPKLFILYFGNTTLLGIYAPILAMISVFASLPNSLGAYFSPKLTYDLAKQKRPKDLYNRIIKIYVFSILVLIPLSLVLYLFIDYFAFFFPKYIQSVNYLEIGIFIAPFVIAKLGNIISIILKQVNFMFYYVIGYAFFQILYLIIIYTFISKDILFVAVLSQIFTLGSLLVLSIYLNYVSVRKYISLQNI